MRNCALCCSAETHMFAPTVTNNPFMVIDMNFMEELKKHAAYHRTVRELRRMPLDTALDLDIYPGDAKQIAHRAVFGS